MSVYYRILEEDRAPTKTQLLNRLANHGLFEYYQASTKDRFAFTDGERYVWCHFNEDYTKITHFAIYATSMGPDTEDLIWLVGEEFGVNIVSEFDEAFNGELSEKQHKDEEKMFLAGS